MPGCHDRSVPDEEERTVLPQTLAMLDLMALEAGVGAAVRGSIEVIGIGI